MECSCRKLVAVAPTVDRRSRRSASDASRRQRKQPLLLCTGSRSETASSSRLIEPRPLETLRWKDDSADDPDLPWLPFLEHIFERVSLQFASEFRNHTDQLDQEWACRISSGQKPAVIASWECSALPKLARIRFTYMSTKSNLQAFNCVMYPGSQFDLPILGMDFLQLGLDKLLISTDFHPLTERQRSEQLFLDVFEEFKHIHQPISSNIYQDSKFFSDAMVLYKGRKSQEAMHLAWRVMHGYLEAFLSLASCCTPDTSSELSHYRLQKQNEYDEWQRENDPVEGVLSAYFGKEWAKKYTGEFCYRGGHELDEQLGALS